MKQEKFLPPGHHPQDQSRATLPPLDFQIQRLHCYVRWSGEHFASFKKLRSTDLGRAESELHHLEDSLDKTFKHLKRLEELLRAGYQPTLSAEVRPSS